MLIPVHRASWKKKTMREDIIYICSSENKKNVSERKERIVCKTASVIFPNTFPEFKCFSRGLLFTLRYIKFRRRLKFLLRWPKAHDLWPSFFFHESSSRVSLNHRWRDMIRSCLYSDEETEARFNKSQCSRDDLGHQWKMQKRVQQENQKCKRLKRKRNF